MLKLSNVKKVARWEFTKTIKSPTFLITTLLIPAIMILAGSLPILLEDQMMEGGPQSIAVIDETGKLYPVLLQSLSGSSFRLTQYYGSEETLREKVTAGDYDAYLVLNEEILTSGRINLYVKDIREARPNSLEKVLTNIIRQQALLDAGLSPELVSQVLRPVTLIPQPVTGEEAELKDVIGSMVLPFGLGAMLMVSVLVSGQVLMQGVTKEKKNRIVEILLSSISATELLVGKIVGFGALGLIQILIWVTVGLSVASRYLDLNLIFGSSIVHWLPALGYFLLGYLMFASLFAAMGAMVKDAESGSQVQGLVALPPVIPLMLSGALIMNPNALWVRVMSFIPIFTPATMLMRYGATTLPLWEILGTMAVLLVFVVIVVRLAARVFEGSILRFERAVSLKEIGSLIRR